MYSWLCRRWLPLLLKLRPISLLGFALLFVGLFLKITWELHEDSGISSIDQNVLIAFSKFRTPALTGVAVDLTALGSITEITLFCTLSVVLLWLNRDRRECVYLAVGSFGAGAGTFAMKHMFRRERPMVVPQLIEISGFSYPSGHSLGATSFYLLLMFLAWRKYLSWKSRFVLFCCAALMIVGVCFSRLYLGVHYPSDVLSGVFLGAAWTCLLTSYFFPVMAACNLHSMVNRVDEMP